MLGTNWKARALAAEAALAEASERLTIIEQIMADRCALVSIAKDKGSPNARFSFVRNGTMTTVEVYAGYSLDIPQLRKTLLEKNTDG